MDEQTLRKVLQEELSGYASKQDLENLTTKDDLKDLATKQDIEESARKVTKDISSLVTDFVQVIADKKADRSQVLSLEVDVHELKNKVFPQ